MQNRERNKQPNWVSIALLVLMLAPEIAIPLGILAGIIYVLLRAMKSYNKNMKQLQNTTYTRNPQKLDDCPKQLFCFHKDKAEHHLSRGKEIDPWDRPDIDIRKYQRKG